MPGQIIEYPKNEPTQLRRRKLIFPSKSVDFAAPLWKIPLFTPKDYLCAYKALFFRFLLTFV